MTALQEIKVDTITGEPAALGDYAGSVLLVVNVASKCGLTPQYEGLEAIYRQFKDQGLVVVGFPANDFRGQEPGDNAEIAEFCSLTYDVTFPLFAKISVVGEEKHPLYEVLTEEAPDAIGDKEAHRARLRDYGIETTEDPEVVWNFEKFLVSRDGNVVARFAPQLSPDDPAIVELIEAELGK
ncbi:MAG: glutathione peroxidase [Candidatus Nanopelagicales bacterium]|nr:glutathione peroxidase [Candidatus Nanopelagicales bacterium]